MKRKENISFWCVWTQGGKEKRKENIYVWLAKREEMEKKVYTFLLICPHKIERVKNNRQKCNYRT